MRPTFKLVLFSRANKDGTRPIMLRVTFLRRAKYYPLHRYCTPDQWEASAGRLRKNYKGHQVENDMLRTYEQRASDALRTFERDMQRFSFDAFERLVFTDRVKGSNIVWVFIERIVQELREEGKPGTGGFYQATANLIKRFDPNAALQDIDNVWLSKFERWQKKERNATDGGLNVTFRTLKASCGKAVKAGIMPITWNPFADYSFSHLKNRKAQRAIPLDQIWALRDAEVHNKRERLALDLFMFSFYCRGINLADIAELKPGNIRDLRLYYVRRKTSKQYSVPINAACGAILDRYKGGEYLFPVYNETIKTEAQKYAHKKDFAKWVNAALRDIAARVGIDTSDFSFYVARHSYANAHKQAGTPMLVIRELMGHTDSNTTEAYLSAFGRDDLDSADRGIF